MRSRMVSPGGETQSGANGALNSVMVVPYVFNTDDGDLRPVNATVRPRGTRVVARGEDQSPAAGKVKRKLPGTVSLERVRISSLEVRHPAGSFHIAQSATQLTCAGRPELLLGDGLSFAQITNSLVLKVNLQGPSILSNFTYLVNNNAIPIAALCALA